MIYQLKIFWPILLFSALLFNISLWAATGDRELPPDKTVRVILLQPSDEEDDPAYPEGIAEVMYEVQRYFLDQCGFTFKLNTPVCEVFQGKHQASWYSNTANGGDQYWWTVFNMQEEIEETFPEVPQDGNRSRWKIVGYINAEGNGGGGGGWVLLPKHDADGAAGYRREGMGRWYGGMAHELGHCFGLPDATSTDGTVMSASFYSYPNCIFSSSHVSSMENNPANEGFWYPEIDNVGIGDNGLSSDAMDFNLNYNQGRLYVEFNIGEPGPVSIGLFDMTGRTEATQTIMSTQAGKNIRVLDSGRMDTKFYLCVLKYQGMASYKKIVIRE